MALFKPKSGFYDFLDKFFLKIFKFKKPDHSLAFLNISQFLSVLNDNIYKFVLIYFLIDLKGQQHASTILSLAGAIYVIPFLLFSPVAGILADRFSKNRLIISIKAVEIVTFLLAIVAFWVKSIWAGYGLLFILSTHSAIFGPSKYGIIPEIVPKNQISKANGLITSFTYLAIIAGAFLASFMTEITHRGFTLVANFCLLMAVIGFISSLGIQYTEPKGSKRKLTSFFLKEFALTLKKCKEYPHLLIAIVGTSFFFFVGAFTQLNIIPFAMESLHFSEVAGGYLFLSTAFGIACGAYIAGRISKKWIELGLSCLAGILIFIMLLLLHAFSSQLIAVILILFFLGMFGGWFAVPFDSFIQIASPDESRGQAIAAANFMSFCGVFLASFAIFLYGDVFQISSSQSFAIMGWVMLLFTIFISLRLFNFAFSFVSKLVLTPFFSIKVFELDTVYKTSNRFLILQNANFFKVALLYATYPYFHLLIPLKRTHPFYWICKMCFSFSPIEKKEKIHAIIEQAKNPSFKELIPCLYLTRKCSKEEVESLFQDFFKKEFQFYFAEIERLPHTRQILIKFTMSK
ncbi:MAG: MFS transporter [Chlamydiae bacterium]|nr:MFS transporter [Chlamydiota bacterium]